MKSLNKNNSISNNCKYLSVLSSFTESLTNVSTPNDLLDIALKTVLNYFGLEFGASYLIDYDQKKARLINFYGLKEKYFEEIKEFNIKDSMRYKLLKDRDILVIKKFKDSIYYNPSSILLQKINTLINLPISYNNVLLGSINLGSSKDINISKEDIDFILTIEKIIAINLNQALSLEKSRQSEENFKLILENSRDYILVLKKDRIVYANKAFLRMFRLTESLIYSESFNLLKYFPESFKEKYFINDRDNLDDTSTDDEYVIIIEKNKRLVKCKHYILNFDQDKALCLQLTDITDKKLLELNVISEKLKLEYILKNLSVGFAIIYAEYNLIYINDVIRNLIRKPLLATTKCYEFFYNQTEPCENCSLKKILSGERLISYEQCVRYNNNPHWFKYIYSPYISETNGDLIGCFKIFIPIDNFKQVEEELIIAKDQAETMNRVKTAFIANISHELRTPLNTILGYSQLIMLESDVSIELLHYNERININATQLLFLINQLLDFSTLEYKKGSLTVNKVNFKKISDWLTNDIKVLLLGKPIKLEIITNLLEEDFFSDEIKIQQILLNLVSNAIKFTRDGCISISMKYKNNVLTFVVSDTGMGISQKDQEVIFEEFKQLSSPTSKKSAGVGLGLAIVKKLVEALDGDITLISEENKGSTFIVNLPNKMMAS